MENHSVLVSFLLTDIVGSTRRWGASERAMTADLERHDKLVRSVIDEHAGNVFKQMGDAFLTAFDDPEPATRAAIEINLRLARETWEAEPLQVRAVVHTGRAQHKDEDYIGLSLSVATRLMHVAHGGQVLVSESTAALLNAPTSFELKGLGRVALRDIARPLEVYQVVAHGLKDHFPPLVDPDARMRGFPLETASFVGRAHEVSDVVNLLGTHRLVTLLGPGGVGKTRLATRVASSISSNFDFIWFVDLAAVTDSELVADTIATAVTPVAEGDPLERAAATLGPGRQLLVVDNLEHLAPEVSESINAILAATTELRMLATSRTPLRLRAEQLYPVPPLAGDGDSEAIELFAERARQVDPKFDVDEHREGVVEICRLVDGLPLGIELAAALQHLKTLSFRSIDFRTSFYDS